MTSLLHVSASPRGDRSESLRLAAEFLDAFAGRAPLVTVEQWDLWDGSLPPFGPAAAGAKMAVFAGESPLGDQAVEWDRVTSTFARIAAADLVLFSVPMWNAGVPYILKQLIDVISQPGMVFGFDPEKGYSGLLTTRAAVIYTAAVYGEERGRAFGDDYQQSFFDGWMEWAGMTIDERVTFRPNFAIDSVDTRRSLALAEARAAGERFAVAALG